MGKLLSLANMLNALQFKNEPFQDCGKDSNLPNDLGRGMRGKCRYTWDNTRPLYFRHANMFVDGAESYGSCSDVTDKSCSAHLEWQQRDDDGT